MGTIEQFKTEQDLLAEIAALRLVMNQAEQLVRIFVLPACHHLGLPATAAESEELLLQIECTKKVYPNDQA